MSRGPGMYSSEWLRLFAQLLTAMLTTILIWTLNHMADAQIEPWTASVMSGTATTLVTFLPNRHH